jgi:hypothetical protein
MTAQSKATNKANFETGDIPTAAQFADLIDSFDDAGTTNTHATLATAHGLTANISAGLAGAASPGAGNVFATMGDLSGIGVSNPLTLGTKGVTNGQVILSSANRENFSSAVSQGDFGGHPDPVMFHGYNAPNSTGYNAAEQSIYTGYEGFYWVSNPEEYVEWYVSWRSPNGTYNGRAFQVSANIVTGETFTTVRGDHLIFSDGVGNVNYFQVLNGAAEYTVPFKVTGGSDAIQLAVRSTAAQANPVFQVQDYLGSNLFQVSRYGGAIFNVVADGGGGYMNQIAVLATTQDNARGQSVSVTRTGAGAAFSYTYAFQAAAVIDATAQNAGSRFVTGGIYDVVFTAGNGHTASATVTAYGIDSNLSLSGAGTNSIDTSAGLHIGDWGPSGVTHGYGILIASQTSGYALYSDAGLVRFGDQVSVVGIQNLPALTVDGYVGSGYPVVTITQKNANTFQSGSVVEFRNNSSGTPTTGFGSTVDFKLKSSTTDNQNAAQIWALWMTATHATRRAALILNVYDENGVREGVRIQASGTAPMLGFYGANAVAKPTGVAVSAEGIHAALVSLGLIAA